MSERESKKLIATNKKAFFDFEILEKLEVGLALVGCEVKSIRQGHISIKEAYAKVINNELWLVGAQVQPYFQGGAANVDPLRSRKLLLHRKQLTKLSSKVDEKQFSLLPLEIYFLKGKVKLLIGLGRSKKMFDKRAVLKEKESKRAVERALKYRG